MLSFKLSALLLACGLTSLSASSVIFEEQKIKVYNVPHSEVNNLDAKKLSEYTEKKPLYSVSQGVSPGKTLIKTPSEDVVVVLDKNRNPILNYNDILLLAETYAKNNIPLIDKQRISNQLSIAKIKTSYKDEKYNNDKNEELIVKIKENKNKGTAKSSSLPVDFASLTLIDNVNYFIENYSKINKTQEGDLDKDVRYHLVKTIKSKLENHEQIDATAVEYTITLDELKMLRNLIVNN